MSWAFRASVILLVMAWGLVPQVTCFVSEETASQAQRDCCKEMANDCSGTNTSMDCCRIVARSDLGVAAKIIRLIQPHVDAAEITPDIAASPIPTFTYRLVNLSDHSPPPDAGVSSLVLRI